MEHMKWGSPEKQAQQAEAMRAKPFEILTNQVPESAILQFMNDEKLVSAIKRAGWPTDEEACEAIATKHAMGAEQIAAMSKYQRALAAERGTTH